MSHTSVNIHDCKSLRVASTDPSNSNSICLQIRDAKGEQFELTAYDFPHHITQKLILAFADDATSFRGRELEAAE